MTEDLIRKVIKGEYFNQFNINDDTDKPFPVIKFDPYSYRIVTDKDNRFANFTMNYNFGQAFPSGVIHEDNVGIFYYLEFGCVDLPEEVQVRYKPSLIKIVDDFIRHNNPSVIIYYTGIASEFKKYSDTFQIVSCVLPNDYALTTTEDDKLGYCYYIAKKELCRFFDSAINKNLACCHDFELAKKLVFDQYKRNRKGITRNDMVKEQRKRILYKWKYLY